MSDDRVRTCCDDVVKRLDALIAQKADRADEPLTEATQCVVRLRDACIEARRARPDDDAVEQRLRRVNSVLSLVIGSHYTLVGLRWKRIEQARDEVRRLLDEQGAPA